MIYKGNISSYIKYFCLNLVLIVRLFYDRSNFAHFENQKSG